MEDFEIKVEEVLQKIRPHLAQDGGGVEFVRYEQDTHTLVLALTGNCRSCPLSLMTLRAGIEKLILKFISEVRRVESE